MAIIFAFFIVGIPAALAPISWASLVLPLRSTNGWIPAKKCLPHLEPIDSTTRESDDKDRREEDESLLFEGIAAIGIIANSYAATSVSACCGAQQVAPKASLIAWLDTGIALQLLDPVPERPLDPPRWLATAFDNRST